MSPRTSKTRRPSAAIVIVMVLAGIPFAAGCVLPDFDEVGYSDAGTGGAGQGTGGSATADSAGAGGADGSALTRDADGGKDVNGQTDEGTGGVDAGGMEVLCASCGGLCPKKCRGEPCTVDSDCLSETCYQATHTCASGSPPPSCSGGLTCADGLSCCDRSVVEGGIFSMGRSTSGIDACPAGMSCDQYEQPEHPVTISSFALDTFEITVGRFRKFVEFLDDNPGWQPAVGAGAHSLIPNSGWNQGGWGTLLPSGAEFRDKLSCGSSFPGWTDAKGANENRPITCVNWYEAFAFCAWDGGRLPTEAEWEYAAAGGNENRLYPWGSQVPDCTYSNFNNGYYCSGGSGSTVTVGSTPKGNGRWGQRDLAGNVWEWVLDTPAVYLSAPYYNWASLILSYQRVLRSGDGFHDGATWLRNARRYAWDAAAPLPTIGARCARAR